MVIYLNNWETSVCIFFHRRSNGLMRSWQILYSYLLDSLEDFNLLAPGENEKNFFLFVLHKGGAIFIQGVVGRFYGISNLVGLFYTEINLTIIVSNYVKEKMYLYKTKLKLSHICNNKKKNPKKQLHKIYKGCTYFWTATHSYFW